jgi:hypothetical protein
MPSFAVSRALVGGSVSSAVDLYNSATGTWSTAQLSVARYALAAASTGNMAIFAVGYNPYSGALCKHRRDEGEVCVCVWGG